MTEQKSRLQLLEDQLEEEVRVKQERSAPLREKLNALRDELQPKLAEMRELEDQITEIEQPKDEMPLHVSQQELAKLKRVNNPPAHTLNAEGTSVAAEPQKG